MSPEPSGPAQVRASQILRVRALWAIPVIVATTVILLMSVFYVGSVVDPIAHLHGLPVAVVDEDMGEATGGQATDLGALVTAGLVRGKTVSELLSVRAVKLGIAERAMDSGGVYATVVIPKDFTGTLLTVSGRRITPRLIGSAPEIRILTNERAGTEGVSIATGVLEPALAAASREVGRSLTARSGQTPAGNPAELALLKSPVTVVAMAYRPLPAHSALGLSAFYIALLTMMCGFIGATIVNASVDAALGYSTTDIGPRWSQRAPVPISRFQTLLTKWTIAVCLTGALSAVMLAVAVGLLGMDAPSVGLLWLFTWFAAATVAIGTLVLFAVLGTQGQLAALLLFVYLGLASAGGTVPLQALPGVLKWVSEVEPLRQILSGVRAILYFSASGDAGMTRGLLATGIGLILWLAVGAIAVTWYDRRGLFRMEPRLLAYVHKSALSYADPVPVQTSPLAPAMPLPPATPGQPGRPR
jgi:YhgE/Pip-like protein